jgi:peptidoglycan/LPS O-acetylase OafA/YrhL
VTESPWVLERLLLAFSIKHNLKYLTDNKKSDEIKSLNGVRCLLSSGLYLLHLYIFFFNYGFINKNIISELSEQLPSLAFSNARLYNVAFLTLSGMLATYSLLKRLDDRKKLSYFREVAERLFRYVI